MRRAIQRGFPAAAGSNDRQTAASALLQITGDLRQHLRAADKKSQALFSKVLLWARPSASSASSGWIWTILVFDLNVLVRVLDLRLDDARQEV